MTIYPAIDLRGGKVVRLEQGRAEAETVYGDDPRAQAEKFKADGASWIHVVDLDGAFEGTPQNRAALEAIAGVGLQVQTGGGMRNRDAVASAFEAGVSRVVIGTKACEDPAFVASLCAEFGDRIVVGLDVKDGFVAVKGWVEGSTREPIPFAREMAGLGAKWFVYTDVSRDGMLSGPNYAALETLLVSVEARVIASGGVGSLDDVAMLAGLADNRPNLEGAIIGKALYDGRLSLPDALAAG